jgi:glucose-fructose oxidoreductase
MGSDLSRRRFLGCALAAGAGMGLGARGTIQAATARPVGVAVVGIGGLTQGEILPALTKTAGCRLAALVSGHPDKARRVAAQYGLPESAIYSYETYDRMADNPAIEMVYIVLPNGMHAEYTIRAAKAGKHVLCESRWRSRPPSVAR